ncbi:MAG: DNA polymerase III subunit alpha [Chloroflexi bacterium]|nr:DNA polymerase III subunit alpha [Chloroflexota bacterium]
MKLACLRTHSYYSFLDSLLSPQDLAQTAKNNGIQALGLTDYQYLTGAIEFYEACLQVDIKPIFGLELDLDYHGHSSRLAFLVKDSRGWSNLSRISSITLVEDRPIDVDTLYTYRQGLICLLGGFKGVFRELFFNTPANQKLSERFITDIKEIFNLDCFFEIQRYANGPLEAEQAMINIAKLANLPLVASQNIHYRDPKDRTLYQTITAIRENKTIAQGQKNDRSNLPFHFPTRADLLQRFQDIPEALENLAQIVERCNFDLPIGKTHYPTFPTPKGQSQVDYLRTRAYDGARKIYREISPEIKNRLDHELLIISEMGYEPIFLIMEDILTHARQLGIPTSSRGSAASSLVAHSLNITSPDPLALNLYFERFLNPARNKPPDIDTDIASHRRDEVIKYVFKKYHPERVAMVGTITRYRPKSAFSDVAKAYGLTPGTIRQLSKKLPTSYSSKTGPELSDLFLPLLQEAASPDIKAIIDDTMRILDFPRHLSVHPGGIVIAPFSITDLIPITYSTSLRVNYTQYDLDGIEKLGMVKIDLLGIRGLTVLGEVADQIQSWHQKEYHNGLQVLDQIPRKDPKTADTIAKAKTIGCFQIESPGMRATLREIQAESVEDIMAALALYRPGPLRGGLRDVFVRRFRGEEAVIHIHESLEGLLSDTQGVILYQEQVLRIAHEIAGLSIAQADLLRRAMSHFDPDNIMNALRNNFISGAIQRCNMPQDIAERIWEMMAAFAGYGFPKAHAASYAQLAWNSAWCKTHYPAEFMCAVLGHGGGYYSQRVYLMEARRMGLTVKPPHVNHSNERFHASYPNGLPVLYMGLEQVRELTQKAVRKIIAQRPFLSLEDFLIRVDPHPKEVRNLILCGAFEGLTTIPAGLDQIKHKRLPGQFNLFSNNSTNEDWDSIQKERAAQEILGVSLELSPLEQFADQILSAGAVSTLEAENLIGGQVCLAGMLQAFRRIRNRSNQSMGLLTLEDLEGSTSVFIPPEIYRQSHLILREQGPFLVEGIMEKDKNSNRIQMVAKRILLMH